MPTAAAADTKLTNQQPGETQQDHLETQRQLLQSCAPPFSHSPPRDLSNSSRELDRFLYSNKPRKKNKTQSKSINSMRVLHIYVLDCHPFRLLGLFTTGRHRLKLQENSPKNTAQVSDALVVLLCKQNHHRCAEGSFLGLLAYSSTKLLQTLHVNSKHFGK